MLRSPLIVAEWLITMVGASLFILAIPIQTGAAFDVVLNRTSSSAAQLGMHALIIIVLVIIGGLFDVGARFGAEFVGKRLSRDARAELYLNLLGKSQTFHSRQRVGDIMARANNDITLLSDMVTPGFDLILDSSVSIMTILLFIGSLDLRLVMVPLLFVVTYILALIAYTRELNPVAAEQRERFGAMNAGLAETIRGIEVVKATAQEEQERRKFIDRARAYRNAFVKNGQIQARYLPPLLLTIALVAAFAQGVILLAQGQITVGTLVAFMSLMAVLRYPASISIFTFSLVQLGVAGSERILEIMRQETELDENATGYAAKLRGEVVFEHVDFSYGGTPVLRDVSFRAEPGQTIAIVGQTGDGKSTLIKLVNRTYDVNAGRILVDGVDVRDWNLHALRSQIATIEQDVFLFSRTIAENIGFGGDAQYSFAAIESAARDAQAHEFITQFKDGYDTEIGERGVTLSGGQRQRLAIARALLTGPSILILDDSTSAIDSATEDEIQQAIRRVLDGRTTLLVTHRLAQIRRADHILVLQRGAILDQGTHEALLSRCERYRRMFARYDAIPAPGASLPG